MQRMQYNFEEKSILGFDSVPATSSAKKEGFSANNEPISVLDTRRSPSPSTSTSTLSSAAGGGGGAGSGVGSADNTASVAAVSGNLKWQSYAPPEMEALGDFAGRKDEWAAELQPIPSGVASFERFGVGLEDWESLLSESMDSPVQDQTLLRWISANGDDGSFNLKQLLQGTNQNQIDGNSCATAIEASSVIDPLPAGGDSTGNVMKTSDFSGCGNNKGKIFSIQTQISSELNNIGNPQNPSCPNPPFPQQPPFSEQKPQIFNQQMVVKTNQILPTPNLNMYSHLIFDEHQQIEPQPKRHNPGIISNLTPQIPKIPFQENGNNFFLRKQNPLLPHLGLNCVSPQNPFMVPKQEPTAGSQQMVAGAGNNYQQQQVTYDHLYKAAELILVGNFAHAQAILARLNHQLSPMEKPYQRVSFYFKEALQMPLLPPFPSRVPTPLDAMLKMGAYRVLSEVSPLIQFMNFTSNQTLTEALEDSKYIHIVDFDIGFGAQWASFMQELPKGAGAPSLKITAFASPTTHHPFELGLMHENLTKFANEFGIQFELEVVNLDSFDPNPDSVKHFRSFDDEAIAVNFPSWSSSSRPGSLPALLRFIKQLKPKIIVSMDQPCERADLNFPQHLMLGLHHYETLLSSIDIANITPDTSNKIERFLLNPRIEATIMGRLNCPDQMPHWKTLFAAAGFTPVPFSGFAEAQAECLVKRSQVRGFHVEKRQLMLSLWWQRKELVSAWAWK